jgi:hypothetical protein
MSSGWTDVFKTGISEASATAQSYNPIAQASSAVKWIVGAIVVLVIMFMFWVLVLAKSNFSPKKSLPILSAQKRLFGVPLKK